MRAQQWRSYSQNVDGVGHHQQVLVVKEADFGHLQDEEVDELDEEHEEEFTDAADLQEDGAGQQAQQHAGREVLRERLGKGTFVLLRDGQTVSSVTHSSDWMSHTQALYKTPDKPTILTTYLLHYCANRMLTFIPAVTLTKHPFVLLLFKLYHLSEESHWNLQKQ